MNLKKIAVALIVIGTWNSTLFADDAKQCQEEVSRYSRQLTDAMSFSDMDSAIRKTYLLHSVSERLDSELQTVSLKCVSLHLLAQYDQVIRETSGAVGFEKLLSLMKLSELSIKRAQSQEAGTRKGKYLIPQNLFKILSRVTRDTDHAKAVQAEQAKQLQNEVRYFGLYAEKTEKYESTSGGLIDSYIREMHRLGNQYFKERK